MKKSKKYPKKIEKNWTKLLIAYILYGLFVVDVFSAETKNDNEKLNSEDSGVRISVKPNDADRFIEMTGKSEGREELIRRIARLESENDLLRAENDLLRDEMAEVLDKLQQQNRKQEQLELSLARWLDQGKVQLSSSREVQLVRVLDLLSSSSDQMALKTLAFCDDVDSMLNSGVMSKSQQLMLRLKMDDLRRESRKISVLTDREIADRKVEKTRILSINHDLQVVVLPIGSVHGAFSGLTLYVAGKATELQLIAVRPYLSLAVVKNGNVGSLTPGMEVVAELK